MEYLVSARKYRPMTFTTVIGQQALTATLKNSIHNGKLAHAYLFCGPRGVGKTTCARIFAKTINCLTPTPDGESCGHCESCAAFDQGRSLNIHELDAASNNSVEDIRELIKQVQIPPQTGRYKVFIIDEVHMLSPAAFNAFLKTLEEPPTYTIFILATTEKHKILPTILSRCQVYDFNRMTLDDTVAHLRNVAHSEGYTADDEALQLIAEKADGGMRDALSIFDQMTAFTDGHLTYQKVCESLNVLSTEYYFRLTDHFLANQVRESLLLLNDILHKGFDPGHLISGMASHMRQLLVARDASTLSLLEASQPTRQRYQEQASKCPLPFIYKAIKLCNTCDQNYRQSHNKRLQVEICLIECAQITQSDDSEGSGRSPRKTLKPIFSLWQAQAQPQPQTPQQAQSHPQTHSTPSHHTPQPHKVDPTPQIPRLKLTTLGPSIRHTAPQAEPETTEKEQLATPQAKPFTQEDIILQWHTYIANMPQERTAMAMRMRAMPLKMITPTTFEVTASNQQVAQYMQNMKESILRFIRQGLGNTTIDMNINTADPIQILHQTSKPALLERMQERNKSIRKLVQELELKINN